MSPPLPYDIARCAGTPHATCQRCARRSPGHPDRQYYIAAMIDLWAGACPNFIARPMDSGTEKAA